MVDRSPVDARLDDPKAAQLREEADQVLEAAAQAIDRPRHDDIERQSLRSRVRASRQAHGEHRALAWLAETGTCPDPRTFYLDRNEEAVVAALRAELRHPDVIAEFVRTITKSAAASLHNRVPNASPRSADSLKSVEKSSASLME